MKNVIAFLCLFLCSMIGISQNAASPYDLPAVIPSSPEVSSILRYSEVPVSYYNGIPNIGVPIYTLQGRELAAPINLSYHAGGHRVNEEASRVGLGWSLSAGGQVSRVVKGLPDDYVNGFIYNTTTADDIAWACNGGNADLCREYRESSNLHDPEPDDFNFSMLGISGRFMFNQDRSINPKGEIVQFPDQNIKIVPLFNGNTIVGFEITDTNGTLYEFSSGNRFVRSQSFSMTNGQFSLTPNSGTSLSYIETWNLTRVTSLNGDVLTFEYTHELLDDDTEATRWEFTHGGQSLILNPLSSWHVDTQGYHNYTIDPPYTTESFSTSYRYIEELSKITSSNGYVKFVQAPEQRLDMRDNAKRLQFVEVYNNEHEKLQEIEFFHDYFESTPRAGMRIDHANSAPNNAQSVVTRRMYLDKLQFRGGYNTPTQQDHYEYSFGYNTALMLPDKQSYAVDHWGYYNGATGNTSMLAIPSGIQISNGANREVNPEYSSACMLNKITYPEGGTTRLYYENNQGDVNTRELPPYIGKSVTVKALPSYQNTITQNGNTTVYRFYSSDFTIATDAKSAPNDSSKTQVTYTGFSDRCDNVDAIYNTGDLVCNDMFFKLFKVGSQEPPITGAIWESGFVLLDKGATYRLEIEITSTGNDYNLSEHYSEIEITWLEDNPNQSVETVDYFGGIRVKEIKTYSESGLTARKSYDYAGGSIISAPIYLSKDISLQDAAGTYSAGFYFPIYRITSNSAVPLLTTQSGYVGYSEVTETIHQVGTSNRSVNSNERETKSIIRTFSKANNYSHARLGGVHVYDWRDGNLLSEDVQDKQFSSTEYGTFYGANYTVGVNLTPPIQTISGATIDRVFQSPIPTFGQLEAAIDRDVLMAELGLEPASNNPYNQTPNPLFVYNLQPGKMLPTKNTVVTKEADVELTQVTETFYESTPNHYNPTKTVTTDSKGDVYQTVMRYPYEENNTVLLIDNRWNIPLVTTSSNAGTILSTVKSEYDVFHGKRQVARILGAKQGTSLEERVTYHDYTPFGQPREVAKTGGTSITYIWGYNYNYPVAKIENATYAEVAALIDESTLQSLTGVALENALAPLRAGLPNAMVSTYEFEPMIGMIKMVDPRGRSTHYKYDAMGRLEFVLDHNLNVLSQNTYHYKNNN